jgi:hypothetical protein
MQVNNISSQAIDLRGSEPQAVARAIRVEQDKAVFDQSRSLNHALNSSPEIRGAEVARAQELIASVKYPPDEVIRGIAQLLAFTKEHPES